jgi:hypothetical protein
MLLSMGKMGELKSVEAEGLGKRIGHGLGLLLESSYLFGIWRWQGL